MSVVVWTQPNCPYCTRVKNALDEAGIVYTIEDLGPRGDPAFKEKRDEFRMFHATTPVVYVDGQALDDAPFGGDSFAMISDWIENL